VLNLEECAKKDTTLELHTQFVAVVDAAAEGRPGHPIVSAFFSAGGASARARDWCARAEAGF
jgi:hypothetical protein